MAATTNNFIDLTGKTFGRLTVVGRGQNNSRGNAQWICSCVCGGTAYPNTHSLRSGRTSSCGCLQRERASASAKVTSKKHGLSKSPEWVSWHAMRARCKYASSKDYTNYGGRGISVCEAWESFDAFLNDMGNRPSPNHSLDRIDPDKGYEPDNCRWATPLEQANNRRDNVIVTIDGQEMTLRNAVRGYGGLVSMTAVERRIKRGWSHKDAVSTPARGR